jgi:hypothetical protein
VVGTVRSRSCCCKQKLHESLLKIWDLIHPREEIDIHHVAQRRRCVRILHLLLLLLLLGAVAGLLLWHDQVKVKQLHAKLLA